MKRVVSVAALMACCACLAGSRLASAQEPGDYGDVHFELDRIAPQQPEEPVFLAAQIDEPILLAAKENASSLQTTIPSTSHGAVAGPRRTLARAPSMFGDSLGPSLQIRVDEAPCGCSPEGELLVTLPGASRPKMAENVAVRPTDRVFFYYNGFHNAASVQTATEFSAPAATDFDFNRFTVGFEKTFLDEQWSLEVRLPFSDGFGYGEDAPVFTGTHVDVEEVGNLILVLKNIVWSNETSAIAAGLAMDVPTGGDVRGEVILSDSTDAAFSIDNQSVHLAPFIGFVSQPIEPWFFQGFLQVDTAVNGSELAFEADRREEATLNDQTLLYIDLSAGRWLIQDRLAAITELHYTTALQDADQIDLQNARSFFAFGNGENRIDMLNLSLGLHAQLTDRADARVAGVVPLRDGSDKSFDSEIQASLNFYY